LPSLVFNFIVYLFTGKKPLEVSVRTPDRSHSYTPGIIPPKIPSTPTTDITDELADGEFFDKPQQFRQTPDPYLGESRNDDDDDSDSMTEIRQHNRDLSRQRQLQSKSFRDYGTQMDDKGTRTIGTMSEPVKTRNSGNETQPQSSSTQTRAARLHELNENEEEDEDLNYERSRQPRRNPYRRSTSRSPSQRNDYDNRNRYTSRTNGYHPRSKSQRSYISSKDPHHTPPPPVEYRTPSPSNRHRYPSSQRSRSPSPSQHRSRPTDRYTSSSISRYHLKSSRHPPRSPSPPQDYRPTTSYQTYRPRDRPQMVSAETDTSLDGMKPTQHRGVQPEPLPTTRDYGVVTSAEKVYPRSPLPTTITTVLKRDDFASPSSNVDKRRSYRTDEAPSTKKNYRLRPESNDSIANSYEKLNSRDDEITTPKSTINDRQKQQRTPIITALSNDNDEYIRQLPRGDSISNPSESIIRHDTLPRANQSPIRQLQQATTTTRNDSQVYNIGTQSIIHQSPTNEFATPFKVRYVRDNDDEDFSLTNNQIRSSTLKRDDLRSRVNQILLLPVINSSRTYVFEKQSIPASHLRQSRINGNFYLSTSPTLRSLNSSFQHDEPEINPDHFNGRTLRSEVA